MCIIIRLFDFALLLCFLLRAFSFVRVVVTANQVAVAQHVVQRASSAQPDTRISAQCAR